MFRANRMDKAQSFQTDDKIQTDKKEKRVILLFLSSPTGRMVIKLVGSIIFSQDGKKS